MPLYPNAVRALRRSGQVDSTSSSSSSAAVRRGHVSHSLPPGLARFSTRKSARCSRSLCRAEPPYQAGSRERGPTPARIYVHEGETEVDTGKFVPPPPVTPGSTSVAEIMRPVAADMEQMTVNLRNVVGERHPMLMAAADQIFGAGGKRLRPMVCFLIARATNIAGGVR